VLITGGASGIGREVARALAFAGANVVIACRDLQKGKEAAESIKSTTKADVEVQQLDLSSFDSIRSLANLWLANKRPLHILVNNAETIPAAPLTAPSSGCEMIYAVAHLGHFLLSNLLLSCLEAAGEARVVSVSSEFHHKMPFRLELAGSLDAHKESAGFMMGGSMAAYCHAKSCNVLFALELARRLKAKETAPSNGSSKKSTVSSLVVHPGWVGQTGLNKYYSWFFGAVNNMLAPKTPEQGAATVVFAAIAPQAESGHYYSDCAEGKMADWVSDSDVQRRFWELSARQSKLSEIVGVEHLL